MMNKNSEQTGAEEMERLGSLDNYKSYSSDNPNKHFFVRTDNPFTRKARVLQAIRRSQTGATCGFIEKDGKRYYHPNLAADGFHSGCNFLSPTIFEYAKYRVDTKKPYETIEAERLFNNFLSSQPMAFNLFYPLMEIVRDDEGQRQLARIVTELLDKDNRLDINKITEVGIEFIPSYRKACLNDKTAMDAFMRYATSDGRKGIIAIETKYTDALGTNKARNPAVAIQAATEPHNGISELFTEEGKARIKSGEITLSQVYRNFLLTEKVRLLDHKYNDDNAPLADSLSIVLAPRGNTLNHADEQQLASIIRQEYRYKFQVLALETFVDALIVAFPRLPIFSEFHRRYLDFTPAEWLLRIS